MTLEDLGYGDWYEARRKDRGLDLFDAGRVVLEHRERYVVRTAEAEYDGEIIGNLRYTATRRSDFPAVGDWVAISEFDEDKVLIHAVYPRRTVIERRAVGMHGEKQVIAANIDDAFLVQAVDRDFSLNRMERYLTICHASGVRPVILLTKTDLVSAGVLSELAGMVKERAGELPVLAVSNETGEGIAGVREMILKGRTYCMLGSSGAGKSTLLNSLRGKQLMKTGAISESSGRGRHVTSHRELVLLETGGIIIDNPGMREVGLADSAGGLESTFERIVAFSGECRYRDCSHVDEAGCAVIEAVERGEIDRGSYENYLKMEREQAHFQSTVAERRQKDKDFGKMVKQFKKIKKG